MLKHTTAIVLAGGRGERLKESPLPKQFVDIHGKPVLAYTLDALEKTDLVQDIVIVYNEDYAELYHDIIETYQYKKIKEMTSGGSTRQASIFAGLSAAEGSEFVVIQNGVSAMVTPEIVDGTIARAHETGESAVTFTKFTEGVARRENGQVAEYLDRSKLVKFQSPQVFPFAVLKDCHERAMKDTVENVTSDVALLMMYDYPVHLVEGSLSNVKITTIEDIYIARGVLEKRRHGDSGHWL